MRKINTDIKTIRNEQKPRMDGKIDGKNDLP